MRSGSGKDWKVSNTSLFLNSNGLVNGDIPKEKPCLFVDRCTAFVEGRCPSETNLKNVAYSCAFARGLSLDAEETKREKAEQEARERREFCLANIEGLLKVVKHSRTSCSDEHPDNFGRCNRCTLLRFQKENYWPDEFDLEITLWERRELRKDE